MRFKKITSILFSLLLCITVLGGCSRNASQNKQNEVNAAFAEAVEKFKNTTHEHGVDVLEASDPSIVWDDDTVKSIKWEYETNYEIRKDSEGKTTDDKIIERIQTKTYSATDGTSKIAKTYLPGNGFKYCTSDDEKYKYEYEPSFESFGYTHPYLNTEALESLELAVDGSQKIFKFAIKKDLRWAAFDCGDYALWDSNVELVDYSGTLTVSENDDNVTLVLNVGYKDKVTGATLKDTITSECNNSTHKLSFPSDLSNYKEESRL